MKLARIGEKIMGVDKLIKRGKLVGGIVGGGAVKHLWLIKISVRLLIWLEAHH